VGGPPLFNILIRIWQGESIKWCAHLELNLLWFNKGTGQCKICGSLNYFFASNHWIEMLSDSFLPFTPVSNSLTLTKRVCVIDILFKCFLYICSDNVHGLITTWHIWLQSWLAMGTHMAIRILVMSSIDDNVGSSVESVSGDRNKD